MIEVLKFFKLLHHVLKPVCRVKSKQHSKFWKVSICDSISSFVYDVSSWELLPKAEEEIEKKSIEYGLTIQPMIFFCHSSEKKFALKLDELYYQFNTFIECMDTCFKLYYVFDLTYPIQSKKFWVFVQRFFFDIGETTDSDVNSLITDIEKL